MTYHSRVGILIDENPVVNEERRCQHSSQSTSEMNWESLDWIIHCLIVSTYIVADLNVFKFII